MILIAEQADFETVNGITVNTIKEVYPHYYPKGAVEYFLTYHNDGNILDDISRNMVFLCLDNERNAVGTVTVKNNEISRLFVSPKYQGRGYGRELLDFAEMTVFEKYSEVVIDASFSAKRIYLKRGYVHCEYNIVSTDNGDFLCYDVMKKLKQDI